MRRWITALAVTAMLSVTTGWVGPSTAHAAATPWTWVLATATGVAPVQGATVRATCPAGYLAVTGGVDPGGALIESEFPNGPYYDVVAANLEGASVTVTAWCALSSQVAVQAVNATMVLDQQGRGLGDFTCGGDLTPLSAAVRWTNLHRGSIAQSGPEVFGGTNAWFVVALGNPGWTAYVTLLCVPNADLPGATWVTQSQTAGSTAARLAVTAACPDRQRLVTGGEHVDSVSGLMLRSSPVGAQAWTTEAQVPARDTLTVAVLCVPDGDPVATFTSVPRTPTSSTTATFTFTATDPAAASRASNWCFLNTVYLGPCNGSYTVTGLTEGQNVFSIEAVTDDGRGGAPTENDRYFWVDLTPPTITLTTPAFTLGNTVNLQAKGNDSQGIGSYRFKETARPAIGADASTTAPVVSTYFTSSGLMSVPVQPGMSYRFDVTTADVAGNVSPVRSVSTAVPIDNFALAASSQWSLIKGSVYTHSLVSRTTVKGATLSHNMYGTRLGVVATTCPTCGLVGVYSGTTLLKTIDLSASSTHYRQVITVALASAPVQTRVVLKVLSTGKLVEIDGLGALVA